MQYYVKIFNKNTSEFVGYYKETGGNHITKMPKGTKYFNSKYEALKKVVEIDDGFIRDSDKKYYVCHAVVCGDHTREPRKSDYRDDYYKEMEGDDYENAITTFIRQNSGRNYR